MRLRLSSGRMIFLLTMRSWPRRNEVGSSRLEHFLGKSLNSPKNTPWTGEGVVLGWLPRRRRSRTESRPVYPTERLKVIDVTSRTRHMVQYRVGSQGESKDAVTPNWHLRLVEKDSSGNPPLPTALLASGVVAIQTWWSWMAASIPVVSNLTRRMQSIDILLTQG